MGGLMRASITHRFRPSTAPAVRHPLPMSATLPGTLLNAYPPTCSGEGIAPSCCSRVSISKLNHDSTILPSTKRATLTPVTCTVLPVGGMPITGPVFLALARQRLATRSPSAI